MDRWRIATFPTIDWQPRKPEASDIILAFRASGDTLPLDLQTAITALNVYASRHWLDIIGTNMKTPKKLIAERESDTMKT